MILFKLRCGAGHEFDGWFRDGAAYERQAARRQISCPDCGDSAVEKAPMAPRIAKSEPEKAVAAEPESVRRMLQKLRREIESNCEDVGGRFADEARRIHRGEAKRRGIYGNATPEAAEELAEEGIEVARIPWIPPSDA